MVIGYQLVVWLFWGDLKQRDSNPVALGWWGGGRDLCLGWFEPHHPQSRMMGLSFMLMLLVILGVVVMLVVVGSGRLFLPGLVGFRSVRGWRGGPLGRRFFLFLH